MLYFIITYFKSIPMTSLWFFCDPPKGWGRSNPQVEVYGSITLVRGLKLWMQSQRLDQAQSQGLLYKGSVQKNQAKM